MLIPFQNIRMVFGKIRVMFGNSEISPREYIYFRRTFLRGLFLDEAYIRKGMFSENYRLSLTRERKQCHMNGRGEIKHLISSFSIFIFFFTAFTIRCYECAPNFTNFSSASTCSNPADTMECTDPFHDSCLSLSITGLRGNASDFAGFTFHSLNCTTKLLYGELKNFTCDLLKNKANTPGVKLVNCEISCCQGDLCNKFLERPTASSIPRGTKPPRLSGSITIKMSMGTMNFSLKCAQFGILGVIPLVVMNIF